MADAARHLRLRWLAPLVLAACCVLCLPVEQPSQGEKRSEHRDGSETHKIVSATSLTMASHLTRHPMPFSKVTQTTTTPPTAPFAGLQARWETVWGIDVTSAELNEANIDRALDLRTRAEQGDLDSVVLLIGAASWCASSGPLSTQRASIEGTPTLCADRFGADIASHGALEWAIFRWTMLLANAGFQDALLYASVRGRDQLFAPPRAADPEVVASLRSQLIGQLQSLAASGSADAASELNSYYMKAVEIGESAAVEARYYADLTERLDPERTGLAEVTDDWIVTRARAPS